MGGRSGRGGGRRYGGPSATVVGDCNPFISAPSTIFSRTLLVTFLLMTFNVNVCQVVEAAASASASASAAAGIERRPSTELERPDGLKMHHYGITSAASSASLHHAAGGTSTASSSSASAASAAALVAGGLSSPASALTGTAAEKPYFDDVNSRNVTTVVDDTAVLKCRVKHKGDRTLDFAINPAPPTGATLCINDF
uniref:Ig-like domain-containing protein n=1 Tax=Anopheles farauti TaxID=69004 RepID=A0A182Q2R8_9DIPT